MPEGAALTGYFHAYIRRALATELDELLKSHPELGYGKLNNAMNEAVRRFVRDVRRELAERDPKAKPVDDEDLPSMDDVITMLRRAMKDQKQKQGATGKRPRSG